MSSESIQAAALIAGTAAGAEVAHNIFGVPRDVLYAALVGACIGLAGRSKEDDWKELLAPNDFGWPYLMVIFKSLWQNMFPCSAMPHPLKTGVAYHF